MFAVVPFVLLFIVCWFDPSTSPLFFGLAILTQICDHAHRSNCFLSESYLSANLMSLRLILLIWITILVGLCILAYVESKLNCSKETITKYKKYRRLSCLSSSGLLAIFGSLTIAFLVYHPHFTPFVTISIPIIIFLNGLFALPLSAFFLQQNSLDKNDLEVFQLEKIQKVFPFLLSRRAKMTFTFSNVVKGMFFGCSVWIIFSFIYLTIQGTEWLWAFVLLSKYRDFFLIMILVSVLVGFASTCITLKDVPRRSITNGFKIGLLVGVSSLGLLCLSFLPTFLLIISKTNDPFYLQYLFIRLFYVSFPLFIFAFCLGGMLAGAARFERLVKL